MYHYNKTIQKMINSDDVVKEDIKKQNQIWTQSCNNPYRILIIESSGSGKANSLFNLINEEPDIDKIYLYAKNLFDAKYQFLINKRESILMILMILKFLLNNRMTWMIFVKTLNNTTQMKNVKY